MPQEEVSGLRKAIVELRAEIKAMAEAQVSPLLSLTNANSPHRCETLQPPMADQELSGVCRRTDGWAAASPEHNDCRAAREGGRSDGAGCEHGQPRCCRAEVAAAAADIPHEELVHAAVTHSHSAAVTGDVLLLRRATVTDAQW